MDIPAKPPFLHRPVTWALLALAVALRLAMVPNQSWDYIGFLKPWYDHIQATGGLRALATGFADYTPPYLYWLTVAATGLADLPPLLSIKLFGMATDFLLASYVYRLLRLPDLAPEIHARAEAGFWAALFLPTVMLNSALWGQCDGIYTTGVLAFVYNLCRHRFLRACLWFGIAFAFKLQTIFMAPLLCLALLHPRSPKAGVLLVPLTYLALVLPAWAVGRPMAELLLIYVRQAESYPDLAHHTPNLYQWVPDSLYWPVMPIGVAGAAFLAMMVMALVWRGRSTRISGLRSQDWLLLAFFFAFFAPFALPKMHERYFYMAEVLCLIHVLIYPRDRLWVGILQICTLIGYLGGDLSPLLRFAGLANAGVMILLVRNHLAPLLAATRPEGTRSRA